MPSVFFTSISIFFSFRLKQHLHRLERLERGLCQTRFAAHEWPQRGNDGTKKKSRDKKRKKKKRKETKKTKKWKEKTITKIENWKFIDIRDVMSLLCLLRVTSRQFCSVAWFKSKPIFHLFFQFPVFFLIRRKCFIISPCAYQWTSFLIFWERKWAYFRHLNNDWRTGRFIGQ